MRLGWLAGGLLALAGCSEQAAVAPTRLVEATAVPDGGLWLQLGARSEHLAPAGHGPAMAWVPLSWVVADGIDVAAGGELLRYDSEALRLWDERDQFTLERDAKRKELDMLRGAGDVAVLESRIRQLSARRAAVAAELELASVVDAEAVRIAELQLADAVAAHAAAQRRMQALERLLAAGAPLSGAELARAKEDEVRTRTARAAPEVNLELARLPAARSTVRRLQLTLADLDAQLGSGPEDGLEGQLRTARERQARRAIDRERGRGDHRRRRHEERVALLKDPVMRARSDGMVQLRDASVTIGSKQAKDAACVFILGPDGLAARLAIPEQLRPLVGEGARVVLRSPSFGEAPVHGRIRTIAPVPESAGDGLRVFTAIADMDSPPAALRSGMSAQCSLAVDATAALAVVPSFCVSDPADPAVLMADGTMRQLSGWRVGSTFVAFSGLMPGERVRVPEGAPASGKVRISALVEPAVFTPVRLRSWNWEVSEVLPDGVPVRAGQRIARLIKVDWWRSADQVRADADLGMEQARLDLVIAQLSAADERAGARADWVRAQLARERAELDAWVARNAYDAVAEARSEAALAAAVVARERATRELAAATEEHAAGGISDAKLRQSRLALDAASTALDRANLEAAARSLSAAWLDLRARDDAVADAVGVEAAKRDLAIIAGETYRARIAGAAARFDGTRRGIDGELRSVADEELLAPADGRLVYTDSGENAPHPGRRLQSWEPFRIATGDGRRATFEVPSRLFGRVAVGATVRIRGPGTVEGLDATVVSVANAFLPPRSFVDEIALGRTIGVEERVFLVTVAFTPSSPDQLPPGSTIHAEL